jgi:poly(hydroxyalkanoate) depolymerase family esterase
MWVYVPERIAKTPSLVVVLHGCKQTAEGYDHGTGWSTLADRLGFVLLFPEQEMTGNPNLCFNWFSQHHTARGCGEALSIAEMTLQMREEYGISPERTFVTGLSAGGAMACVMLAAYPDMFAAGAIIAGLPYGAASNVHEAFRSMFQGVQVTADEAGDKVRAASQHRGPWPAISIWHGSADKTVVPGNADAIAQQWLNVHGLSAVEPEIDTVEGYVRQTWRGPDRRALVRSIAVEGMDHGVPLHPNAPEEAVGNAGPFLLDVGLCSTREIAADWGLLTPLEHAEPAPPLAVVSEPEVIAEPKPEPRQSPAAQPQTVPSLVHRLGSRVLRILRRHGFLP